MVQDYFDVLAGYINSWCIIINSMPHQSYYTISN